MSERESSRLSDEQWQQAQGKAIRFRNLMVRLAEKKAADETPFFLSFLASPLH